jgi:predicted aspartyl protease
MVKMKVEGQPMIFMVDPGAEHSVVTKPVAPLTKCRATIVRATNTQTAQQFC